MEVGWDTVASLAVRVSCCTIAQRSIEVQFLGAKSASREFSEYYFHVNPMVDSCACGVVQSERTSKM